MLILTEEGGTHHGLKALGVGSNKKKRERAARLALAAVVLLFVILTKRLLLIHLGNGNTVHAYTAPPDVL